MNTLDAVTEFLIVTFLVFTLPFWFPIALAVDWLTHSMAQRGAFDEDSCESL